MSGLTRATRRNIPEDTILHSHRCENLKSYTYLSSLGIKRARLEADRFSIPALLRSLPWLDRLVAGFPPRRSRFESCGTCGGHSGTGAGFLRVLRLPLPVIRHSSTFGARPVGHLVAPLAVDRVPLQPKNSKNNRNTCEVKDYMQPCLHSPLRLYGVYSAKYTHKVTSRSVGL
jgi:hypothetical protein